LFQNAHFYGISEAKTSKATVTHGGIEQLAETADKLVKSS